MRAAIAELPAAIAHIIDALGGEGSEACICLCLHEASDAPVSELAPSVHHVLRTSGRFDWRLEGGEVQWSRASVERRPASCSAPVACA